MAKNVQKLPVPRPVSINEVCSECGEIWALHPENATLVDCVRLLKAKPSTTYLQSLPCNCWCHHSGTVTYPWWNTTTITVSNTDIPQYPMLSGTSSN